MNSKPGRVCYHYMPSKTTTVIDSLGFGTLVFGHFSLHVSQCSQSDKEVHSELSNENLKLTSDDEKSTCSERTN